MTDITLESYVTKIDVSDDEIALLVDNKEIDNLIDSSIVKSKKYIINEKIIVKIRYIKKITLTFDKSKNVLSEDDLSNNASTKEHAITSVNKPPNHWSADCQMIASPGTITLLKNHDPVVVDNELDINNMSKKLWSGKINNKGMLPIRINMGQAKNIEYMLDLASNFNFIFLLAK